MGWDKEKQNRWNLKRRKEYRMVCLRNTTADSLKALRLSEKESYDEIIRRILVNWNPRKVPIGLQFVNSEDKD
jgi:hypothetical protein